MLDIERLARLETIIESVNEQVASIKDMDHGQSKELNELKDLIAEAIDGTNTTRKENEDLKNDLKFLEDTVKDLKRKIEFLSKLKNFISSPLVAAVFALMILLLASNTRILEFMERLIDVFSGIF